MSLRKRSQVRELLPPHPRRRSEAKRTDTKTLLRAANAHHQAGRLEQAAGRYRQVIEREPRNTAALFYLGRLLAQTGKLEESIRLLRRATMVDPSHARIHSSLASTLLHAGREEEALASVERAVELGPDDAEVLTAAARCLGRLWRFDEAIVTAQKAHALAPDDPTPAVTLGDLYRQRGDFARARTLLEPVVAALPGDRARRRDALRQLSLVLDHLGEYDRAFELFERCGREIAEGPDARRIDPSQLSRRIEGYRTVLALLARWSGAIYEPDARSPVFMVGFPRCGTTMTEQILAAHPDVITSGEQPIIHAVKQALTAMFGGTDDVPSCLARLERGQVVKLRSVYWQQARAMTGTEVGGRLFIDKLPLNIVELGLINVLFPETRVIVCLRDPRDVCLSCLMQEFWLNIAMVNFVSLERTAAFYAEVMAFWLDVRHMLTIRVLEVRYEDTVTDPQMRVRRMLEFFELDWDAGVLKFHERARQRHISTPSYQAVTEPIHRRAVGRWQHYREHFEPVLPHLRRFIEAFGYAT